MRFATYRRGGNVGIAVRSQDGLRGIEAGHDAYPGSLEMLVGDGDALHRAAASLIRHGSVLNEEEIAWLPPLRKPPKIVCVGLNYADHTKESPYEQPGYPTFFARFASSTIGHGAPIIRPTASEKLDFEGELAVIVGRGGRHIGAGSALQHVAGYSVFNDGSVRDFQMKTPQWTVGKNFDGTGPFGPEFVTADELPAGAKGLRLETRVNGAVMQSATTSDMLFDVERLIVTLSEVMTLEPGDVIVSGTPSGVGNARKPPIYLRPGDACSVSVEGVGFLCNIVVDEGAVAAPA